MIGRRKSQAISSAISGLVEIDASAEPPRTVKSSPTTTTVRPSILPRPITQLAGVRFLSSPCSSYSAMPEVAPISWKLVESTNLSMRSRTVSRPWSRCRLTLSTPPISRANASRRARSSSSGFQFIRVLRRDDFIIMGRYRKRFALQPIAEQLSVGAFEEAADRAAQFQKLWRDLPVQPLLIIHRREQSDRDPDEGLILRRPQRHREAVDMRAPQTAGDDIAMFAQEAAVVFLTPPQQLGVVRNFPVPFCEQSVADVCIARCRISMAPGGAPPCDAGGVGFSATHTAFRG